MTGDHHLRPLQGCSLPHTCGLFFTILLWTLYDRRFPAPFVTGIDLKKFSAVHSGLF